MASFIGWLDYSEAEQQQVREIVRLFSEKGTVDDLGIGTLRDAISNRLFPGTSVVQTRARYFLFVPWIFQRAEARHRSDLLPRAEAMERKLIEALRSSSDQDGLIGRHAGKDVKNLPSAIYWTGLAAYGIFLQPPLTRAQYNRVAQRHRSHPEVEDEIADRAVGFWQPTTPAPPAGFFDFTGADFDLTREEADWLSERVVSTESSRGPNLLSDFVRQIRRRPEALGDVFWNGPLPPSCMSETTALVGHAQRFSSAMQGAALVYNLMLAQTRNDDDRGDGEYATTLRDELDAWAEDAHRLDVPGWGADLRPFRELLPGRVGGSSHTWDFVRDWCQILASVSLTDLADNAPARSLVREREIRHKRNLARFGNRARLHSWQGGSGVEPLDFRWSQVRRFLSDLSSGFQGAPGSDGREVAHAPYG